MAWVTNRYPQAEERMEMLEMCCQGLVYCSPAANNALSSDVTKGKAGPTTAMHFHARAGGAKREHVQAAAAAEAAPADVAPVDGAPAILAPAEAAPAEATAEAAPADAAPADAAPVDGAPGIPAPAEAAAEAAPADAAPVDGAPAIPAAVQLTPSEAAATEAVEVPIDPIQDPLAKAVLPAQAAIAASVPIDPIQDALAKAVLPAQAAIAASIAAAEADPIMKEWKYVYTSTPSPHALPHAWLRWRCLHQTGATARAHRATVRLEAGWRRRLGGARGGGRAQKPGVGLDRH
jgi:hypothetical protein